MTTTWSCSCCKSHQRMLSLPSMQRPLHRALTRPLLPRRPRLHRCIVDELSRNGWLHLLLPNQPRALALVLPLALALVALLVLARERPMTASEPRRRHSISSQPLPLPLHPALPPTNQRRRHHIDNSMSLLATSMALEQCLLGIKTTTKRTPCCSSSPKPPAPSRGLPARAPTAPARSGPDPRAPRARAPPRTRPRPPTRPRATCSLVSSADAWTLKAASRFP